MGPTVTRPVQDSLAAICAKPRQPTIYVTTQLLVNVWIGHSCIPHLVDSQSKNTQLEYFQDALLIIKFRLNNTKDYMDYLEHNDNWMLINLLM